MFDFSMCFGVVASILHRVDILASHYKRFKHLIESRATHKDFAIIYGGLLSGHPDWNVNGVWLTIPNINAASTDIGSAPLANHNIDDARGWNDAAFVVGQVVRERLTRFQFDNIEENQRRDGIIDVHDRLVFVVEWRDVHGVRLSGERR